MYLFEKCGLPKQPQVLECLAPPRGHDLTADDWSPRRPTGRVDVGVVVQIHPLVQPQKGNVIPGAKGDIIWMLHFAANYRVRSQFLATELAA